MATFLDEFILFRDIVGISQYGLSHFTGADLAVGAEHKHNTHFPVLLLACSSHNHDPVRVKKLLANKKK